LKAKDVTRFNVLEEKEGNEIKVRKDKGYYAVGFDALVKRWNKCVNTGGGYVDK
jgi:hypothetical protein